MVNTFARNFIINQKRKVFSTVANTSLRKFLLTLWNTYSFFVTYANIDGYTPSADLLRTLSTPPAAGPQAGVAPGLTATGRSANLSDLDRWVLSELHELVEDVTMALEGYDPPEAGRKILV